MEKVLRFQNSNYDQVFYPLSKLRGFSRQDAACGGCLYIHFDPLRNTTQPDGGASPTGNFSTDYVKIKFTDSSVLGTVVRNILTNIASEKGGIVTILEVFGTAVRKQAFDTKGSNTSQYLCTPQTPEGEDQFGSANANCAGVTWADVIEIHMAEG